MAANFNPLLASTSTPLQHTVTAAVGDGSRMIFRSFESIYDNEDLDEEDITVEELKVRMAYDNQLLRYLEEKQRNIEHRNAAMNPSSLAYIKKKKLARSQDIILKHMWKMMRECDVKGFVYGIVPSSEKPISASSDNLRDWWQRNVSIDRNIEEAILRYNANIRTAGPGNPYRPSKVSASSLMEFQDRTLGMILSALIQHCNPPQRSFPLDNGVPPPWWPEGKESWWSELVPKQLKRVPYRRPHDLNKAIKAGVIIAVLKHLMPKTELICECIRRSRSFQDKLTSKEIHILFAVIKREKDIFLAANPRRQAAVNDLIEISSSNTSEGEGNVCRDVNSHDAMKDKNVEEVAETSSRKRVAQDYHMSSVLKRQYVCDNSSFNFDNARRDHQPLLQWNNRRPSVFKQFDDEIMLERLQARQDQERNQGALVRVHAKDQQAIERLMSSYEGNTANPEGLRLNQDQASLQNSQPVPVEMSRSYEQNNIGHQQNHVDMQESTILKRNDSFSEEDLIRFINGDGVVSEDHLDPIQPVEPNQNHQDNSIDQVQQQVEMNQSLQQLQMEMNRSLWPQEVDQMISSQNQRLQQVMSTMQMELGNGNQEHVDIDEGFNQALQSNIMQMRRLEIDENHQSCANEGGNYEFVGQQFLHQNLTQRKLYVSQQSQPTDHIATGFDFEIVSQQSQPTDNALRNDANEIHQNNHVNNVESQNPPTDTSYQQEYGFDEFAFDYQLGNEKWFP